ncbi:uncharacterized protein LOC110929481 isoform X1 [Helianthus annuus]|uniref:uncharacterized protein LOC110898707 n=1 Tax=Helianthus annuus TaxID=4232 RepID=UPI000B8F361D|nr:uncharacterized protein LOC110898707 [Helianthus annuus]XP_022001223.1 uncharacterized protein LOC110898707 [Helianthus annuus]XP_022001224.1 uncharacterized protein LOC110898707 [Helianthus annuus]XP_022001225.1 uncharacterized protein LOC110898707 [Helianthus annuus]XP_022001226.1 uncharacterized protein LOC110898707 [Helianthus annuus]XP_035843716.1 uncharacterized protein LOC110929481 isoform X1 [Helianthus annuus]XP_035843717.1 uncharacterized protein LOC110929481 isoform X1 [Helianth
MDPSVVQSVVPSKPIQSNVPSGTIPFLTKPNPKNYALSEMSLPKSYQDGLRLLSEQNPNSELWKGPLPDVGRNLILMLLIGAIKCIYRGGLVIKPKLARPGRVPVTTCVWDCDGKSVARGIGDDSIQEIKCYS